MGFKGILDGMGDGRQIRLELVGYRRWHVLNVLLMSQGFFSSAEGNMRDIGASRHIDSGWIVIECILYIFLHILMKSVQGFNETETIKINFPF